MRSTTFMCRANHEHSSLRAMWQCNDALDAAAVVDQLQSGLRRRAPVPWRLIGLVVLAGLLVHVLFDAWRSSS